MTIHTQLFNDADTEALLERIAGRRLDPEVYQRIQERGNKATEEIREKFGTIEIAVELIRETRGESVDEKLSMNLPAYPMVADSN
ncbi:MAG: hypothetical protein WCH39_18555 [Schlesneria sp.]